MENHSLAISISVYNSVVGAFAAQGEFDVALGMIKKMRDVGLDPINETYKEILRAYGERGMYDKMRNCVKKMTLSGCCPDEATFNLLVAEYARGRLLAKVEAHCATMRLKRMKLHPSTLVEMLEAYTELGIVGKMEMVLKKVLICNAFLKEGLIKKVASVYVEQYRYVQLEEFGIKMGSILGRTALVWCMILLASACLQSTKGMKSVTQEMERSDVQARITYVNIMASAYLKMRNFKELDALLCHIGEQKIKPDLMTVGILFDGCEMGYDCTRALEAWRRSGFLNARADIDTDPLVLVAFGKGSFLKNCEKVYATLDEKEKEESKWRYKDLINLVFRNRERLTPLSAAINIKGHQQRGLC